MKIRISITTENADTKVGHKNVSTAGPAIFNRIWHNKEHGWSYTVSASGGMFLVEFKSKHTRVACDAENKFFYHFLSLQHFGPTFFDFPKSNTISKKSQPDIKPISGWSVYRMKRRGFCRRKINTTIAPTQVQWRFGSQVHVKRRYHTLCDTSIKKIPSKPIRTSRFQSKNQLYGWKKQSDKAKLKIEEAIVAQGDTIQVKMPLLSLFHQSESLQWAWELLEDQSTQSKQADPFPDDPNYHPWQQKTGKIVDDFSSIIDGWSVPVSLHVCIDV